MINFHQNFLKDLYKQLSLEHQSLEFGYYEFRVLPCSLLLVSCSLFLVPCSLFLVSCLLPSRFHQINYHTQVLQVLLFEFIGGK